MANTKNNNGIDLMKDLDASQAADLQAAMADADKNVPTHKKHDPAK